MQKKGLLALFSQQLAVLIKVLLLGWDRNENPLLCQTPSPRRMTCHTCCVCVFLFTGGHFGG